MTIWRETTDLKALACQNLPQIEVAVALLKQPPRPRPEQS